MPVVRFQNVPSAGRIQYEGMEDVVLRFITLRAETDMVVYSVARTGRQPRI